jgi:hypothetical protein
MQVKRIAALAVLAFAFLVGGSAASAANMPTTPPAGYTTEVPSSACGCREWSLVFSRDPKVRAAVSRREIAYHMSGTQRSKTNNRVIRFAGRGTIGGDGFCNKSKLNEKACKAAAACIAAAGPTYFGALQSGASQRDAAIAAADSCAFAAAYTWFYG